MIVRSLGDALNSVLVLDAAKNVMSARARSALVELGHVHWAGSPSERAQGPPVKALQALTGSIRKQCGRIFGSELAEFRIPTGSVANGVVVASLAPPGSTIMVPPQWAFGHKSLSSYGNSEGARRLVEIPWKADTLEPNLVLLRDAAREARPAMIVLGSSRPLFPEPIAEVAAIARECGAVVVYDASHVLGLIAGGAFPNPIALGFDVLTGSTHKTMPGPLGALVVCRTPSQLDAVSATTDTWLSSYSVGGLAALGVVLDELEARGEAYAKRIVENARTLAAALERAGLGVVAAGRGFTSTHQVLVDVTNLPEPAATADRLGLAGIYVNPAMRVDGRLRKGAPGVWLRLGTSWLTRRGFDPADVQQLGAIIAEILLQEGAPAEHRKAISLLLAVHDDLAYTLD